MRSLPFSVSVPLHPVPRLKRPVEGLLLDCCNVLYDTTGWHRWLLQVLRRFGLHAQHDGLFHVWKKDYLDAVHCGLCDPCDALRRFLQALGLTRGQIDELAVSCRARRLRWEAEVRLLPGVKNTLRRIASIGIPVAIVGDTEYPSAVLRERLEKMGLRDALSAVVSSRDLGCVKPNPRCYSTALKMLGLSAPQGAFVGYDADDLEGAARLGMQTISFNTSCDLEADVHLTRFAELLELVTPPSLRNRAG